MPPSGSPAKSSEDSSAKPSSDAPAELNAIVDDLLDALSTKFMSVSTEILQKMDSMSKRLDQMEAALVRGDGGASLGK